MKLLKQKPRQTLNPAYRRQRPGRTEINLFKANLLTLLDKIDESESEEHLKNQVRDFLRDTYYKETNEVNTKGRQDLAIYTGKTNESKVGVIIEAKRPKNVNEWFKGDSANCKAFQELVLYYLRERANLKNLDIKYLIATNIYEWYIIEASYFEHLFFSNKTFLKDFVEFDKKQKVTTNTELFYNSIAKPFIDAIDKTIPCAYFNIKDFEKTLRNKDKKEDANLIALIKILSPQHLLKLEFADDSNSLKESFYKELLHIIGLEERKEGGKYIIDRKLEGKRNEGSLIENAINMLETEDPLHKITDLSVYGSTREERIYNIALELCITWINRILFLKLLEGQLQNYHQKNPEYLFLNSEIIPNYDELHKLFHQVLAKTLDERKKISFALSEKYKRVPYLNSSLFDISKLEDATIKINSLDNDHTLELIPTTVLKEIKKKNQGLKALDYLFRFLNAFDFSSEGGEEIQEDENRTLINASVLGKVFEKINGYKEGSIYTPGFITMYMCNRAIRAAVIQKFKDKYNWKIEEFVDLKNYLKDRRTTKEILEDNALINSIRICDPAVGSGHFLVSSLNEIIAIKSELGLLADKSGDRLSDYQIVIAQDELIVTDQNGNDFKYEISNGKPLNKEMQRLQKALFEEKQTIIENCLFGVDINPNSVKICGLRLWIELLKNAYYKENTNFQELETLPNIDINIKCNNSLISRFALDADLSKALKSIKYNIEAYRGFVNDYKNAKSREVKREIEVIIDGIKNDFKTEIGKNDPKQIKLSKLSGDLFNLVNQTQIFDQDAKQKKTQKEKKEKLEADIKKLAQQIEEIKTNAVYKNAFEWRFEFPEVLNNKGEFEGFDLIIGNPPYISAMEMKKSLSESAYKILKQDFETAKGTVDLFIYFFEKGIKLLKSKGQLAYITPNRYLSASYGEALREFLFNKTKINEIVDYSHVKVFKEASTYPVVTSLTYEKSESKIYDFSIGKYDDVNSKINYKTVDSEKLNFLEGYIWGYLLNDKMKITEQVINSSVSINECAIINATSTASEADEYHDLINEKKGFKLINTGTIDRYKSLWGSESLTDKGEKYLTPYLPKDNDKISKNRKELYNSSKIILAKIAITTEAFYDAKGEYASVNTNCFHSFKNDYNPKYILAWLNSKLFQYTFECFFEGLKMQGGYLLYSSPNVSKMFIKKPSESDQKTFASIVDYIVFAHSINNQLYPQFFERLIDALVYELYLPDAMKNANCEVIKHLTKLPALEFDSDDKNLKIIERVYKELSDPKNPLSASMLKLLNVEEVNIIEGRT